MHTYWMRSCLSDEGASLKQRASVELNANNFTVSLLCMTAALVTSNMSYLGCT